MSFAENSTESNQVQRLAVRELPPRTPPASVAPATPTADPAPARVAIAAFTALGYALSARVLLLLALVGAFVLAVMAMMSESLPRLEVLVAWGLLTILPCTILEIRRRLDK